jgi:hypothetical protein
MGKRVICVKQGNKYSSLQVEKLYAQVKAWVPDVDAFMCITDDPDPQLHRDIRVVKLPDHPGLKGWWAKMYQFALKPYPTLYLDIDLQIRDNFNCYYTGKIYAPRDPLAEYKPDREVDWINSSVMWYQENYGSVFEHYIKEYPTWQRTYRGDQEYLWGEHREKIEYIGDYTESFKWGSGEKHGFARKPIVLYHGEDVKKYV